MHLFQRNFKSQNEMVDHLLEKHNAIVGPDDLVYMLGDVLDERHTKYLKRVGDFNGRKVLVRGNHDRSIPDEEFAPYFEQIVPEGEGLVVNGGGIEFWATHYPTRGRKDMFNLVGHVHAAWKVQLNMLNVGVDVHHYAPINLDIDVPFLLNAITKYYDDDIWVAYDEINATHKGARGKAGRYFS